MNEVFIEWEQGDSLIPPKFKANTLLVGEKYQSLKQTVTSFIDDGDEGSDKECLRTQTLRDSALRSLSTERNNGVQLDIDYKHRQFWGISIYFSNVSI